MRLCSLEPSYSAFTCYNISYLRVVLDILVDCVSMSNFVGISVDFSVDFSLLPCSSPVIFPVIFSCNLFLMHISLIILPLMEDFRPRLILVAPVFQWILVDLVDVVSQLCDRLLGRPPGACLSQLPAGGPSACRLDVGRPAVRWFGIPFGMPFAYHFSIPPYAIP